MKRWPHLVRRLYISSAEEREVVDGFRDAYVAAAPDVRWMGEQVVASPLDLWIYQEIVHETRPEVILAVNTASARYLADLAQVMGRGEVISTAAGSERAVAGRPVLAVVGSENDLENDLRSCAALVSRGSYLIVEDVRTAGRTSTVEAFLRERSDFGVNPTIERTYLTPNGAGYMRRR